MWLTSLTSVSYTHLYYKNEGTAENIQIELRDDQDATLKNGDSKTAVSYTHLDVYKRQDGGPGITQIMAFLMGSSEALKDRYDFMKFQVFQWLIGATDGHAKNF